MGPDQDLTSRLRAALADAGAVSETKMFGGTCFMLDGNMVACASKRGLLVRVGKEAHAGALALPGARSMEMGGRTMEGYVFVDPGVLDEKALSDWLARALAFVRTLPPKPDEERSPRSTAKRK